jgi:hypothetical protein
MTRSGILFATILILLAAVAPAPAFESGVFHGRVRDVAGAPLAGAEIFIYRSNDIRGPADFISAATDQNGAFQITLPVGRYWPIARIRKDGARYGPLKPGDRHSGEPLEITVQAELVLPEDFVVADLREAALLMKKTDADFHSVQGRILGENGQPVENAYAFAYTSALVAGVPAYLSLWTDASGRYTLFLPAGEYYFGQATEFPPEPASRSLKKIRIEGNMEMIDIRWDYSS